MQLILCSVSMLSGASATADTLTKIETLTDNLCTINSDIDILNQSFSDVLAKACSVQSLSAALESKLSTLNVSCSLNDQTALSVTDVSQSKVDNLTSILDEIDYYVDAAADCRGTPITGSTTISSPGKYYLANSITGNFDGYIINITSSDVYFDLNGKTLYNTRDLSGSASSFGCIRVFFNSSTVLENVTIANGYLRAGLGTTHSSGAVFPTAVALGPSSFFTLKNVYLRGLSGLRVPTTQEIPHKHVVIKNIKSYNLQNNGFTFSYATSQTADAGPFLFRDIEDYKDDGNGSIANTIRFYMSFARGIAGRKVSNIIIRNIVGTWSRDVILGNNVSWSRFILLTSGVESALVDGFVLRPGSQDATATGIEIGATSANCTVRNCQFGNDRSGASGTGACVYVAGDTNAIYNNLFNARIVSTQDQNGIEIFGGAVNNYIGDNVVNGGFNVGFLIQDTQNSLVGNYCFNTNGANFSGAAGTTKTVTISQATGFPGGTPIPSRWDNINMTT